MRTIKLLSYDIVIKLHPTGDLDSGRGGGSINSSLKFDIPKGKDEELYNSAIDGILKTVLGHAIAGIDVESPQYLEGIESAVEGLE